MTLGETKCSLKTLKVPVQGRLNLRNDSVEQVVLKAEDKVHSLTLRDVQLNEAGQVRLTAKDFQTEANLFVKGRIYWFCWTLLTLLVLLDCDDSAGLLGPYWASRIQFYPLV